MPFDDINDFLDFDESLCNENVRSQFVSINLYFFTYQFIFYTSSLENILLFISIFKKNLFHRLQKLRNY